MKYFIFLFFCVFETFIFSFSHISLDSLEAEKKNVIVDEHLLCSSLDSLILNNFFQDLFSTSAAGYVLYGSKPLYIGNPSNEKNDCIGTQEHKACIEIWEALNIWKNLQLEKKQTNYFLHISNPSTNPAVLENEFLFINRDAFLKVVNENLLLFQYEFGLNVSADSLLNKLLDKKESISTLFKGKTALLGIVLGYGTKNSLAYKRGVNIVKLALGTSLLSPPYRSDLPALNENDVIKKCAVSDVVPGFGYASIKDEIEDLSNAMGYPTDKYAGKSTKIVFSYQKDSQESKDLIRMYQKAQSKMENVLHSQSFLKEVFGKFNSKLEKSKKDPYSFHNEKIAKILPNLVAQSICEHFSGIDFWNENNNYWDDFISGMKDAEKLHSDPQDVIKAYDDVDFLDSYQFQLSFDPQIKHNRNASKVFFKAISKQPDIVCIEPLKIYYQVIKSGDGEGEILNDKTKNISIHYTIKDIEGKFLSGSYKLAPVQTFETSKLIAGLVHGIMGMRKNEIREIFIHQDFAYGAHSKFSLGKALSVQVELVDSESNAEEMKLPELIPLDLLHFQSNKSISKNDLQSLQKKYIAFCGFRTWLHYKKAAKIFILDDILNIMDKARSNERLEPLLDEFGRKVLRRFDLYLYSEPPLILSKIESDCENQDGI